MERVKKIVDMNAHISNIQSVIFTGNDVSKVRVSFENIGENAIVAVKLLIKAYNIYNEVIKFDGKDSIIVSIEHIHVMPNCVLENILIELATTELYSLEIQENQITYADSTVIDYKGKRELSYEINQIDYEERKDAEVALALNQIVPVINNMPKLLSEGWICTCGKYNAYALTMCSKCHASKDTIVYISSKEGLKNVLNQYPVRYKQTKKMVNRMKKTAIKNSTTGKSTVKAISHYRRLACCSFAIALISLMITIPVFVSKVFVSTSKATFNIGTITYEKDQDNDSIKYYGMGEITCDDKNTTYYVVLKEDLISGGSGNETTYQICIVANGKANYTTYDVNWDTNTMEKPEYEFSIVGYIPLDEFHY